VAVFLFALLVSVFSAPTASAATFSTQQRPANLDRGLVGWWTFDGKDMTAGNATATDRSGNGNVGALKTACFGCSIPRPFPGVLGQSLSFEKGYFHYVEVEQDATINDLPTMTISAWIYPRSYGDFDAGRILDKSSASSQGWTLRFNGGRLLRFWTKFTGGSVNWYGPSINLREWQHIVVTYDHTSPSNQPIFYLNGIATSSTAGSSSGTYLTDASYPFIISGNSPYYDGIQDDVRIYNRILTPAEIKQLYGLGQVKISSKAGAGKAPTPKTLDSTGDMGSYTDIAQGSDGFPVMSYFDGTSYNLKFLKCNDALCNSTTIRTLDSTGVVGQYTSIAIGRDGFPVMSYYYDTTRDLKFIKCNDVSCSSITTRTLDSTNNIGTYTSLAIGRDGYPVIVYDDSTNLGVKFIKCQDTSCSSIITRTLTSLADRGSVAIGRDGYPVVVYNDPSITALRFMKCNDLSCSSTSTQIIDASTSVYFTSVTIGRDGFPVVAYRDDFHFGMKFAKCNDAGCTSSVVRDASSGGGGYSSTIVVGRDGYPLLAYYDGFNDAYTIVKCNDPSCSSVSTHEIDSIGLSGGLSISLAIGKDGYPIISYYDPVAGDLKFISCGAYCGSGVTVGATQSSVIPSGLVGYWSFNGPDVDWRANKAKDRSGQGNDGAIINMSTSTAGKGGKVGQGFRFDGTDDHIDVGSASSLDDINVKTVTAWVAPAPASIVSTKAFIIKGTGSNGTWSLLRTTGGQFRYFQSFDGSPGTWRTEQNALSLREWTHVAVSFDRTSSANIPSIYINGVATSSVVVLSPSGTADSDAVYNLYFARGGASPDYFTGTLDEVRVYNRILTASEIRALYNAGK